MTSGCESLRLRPPSPPPENEAGRATEECGETAEDTSVDACGGPKGPGIAGASDAACGGPKGPSIAGANDVACGGPKGPRIAGDGDGPTEDTVAPLLIAIGNGGERARKVSVGTLYVTGRLNGEGVGTGTGALDNDAVGTEGRGGNLAGKPGGGGGGATTPLGRTSEVAVELPSLGRIDRSCMVTETEGAVNPVPGWAPSNACIRNVKVTRCRNRCDTVNPKGLACLTSTTSWAARLQRITRK